MKYNEQEKKDILARVSSLVDGKGGLSRRAACKQLGVAESTIRRWDKVTIIVEEEEPKYTVTSKNKVIWEAKGTQMEIDLELLDSVFYNYSKHGLNKTAVQVQNLLGFSAVQWQSFKRTFELVKDSDVFSPYSLSQISGKERTDMIASKISEKYSEKNMRDVIAYEANKQRGRAYEKAIKLSEGLDYRRREFETAILDYVSGASKKVNVRVAKKTTGKHGVHTIADLHIGADIEKNGVLPAYNIDIAKQRLDEAAELINQENNAKNTICFNGDFIESFTGLNHINSWKGIDKKYGYGTKATIMACELLTDFLQKVDNVEEVLIVAGNHDRVTSNNNEDVDGEVVHWIHFILNERFKSNFNVDCSVDVISRAIDNVCYIWTHGHLTLSKRSPAEIINIYGIPGMFCLIIEGHFHTRKVKADTSRYRSIVISSIFTGNSYSKNLGYSTLPGFVSCFSNGRYPIVVDIPLQIEY